MEQQRFFDGLAAYLAAISTMMLGSSAQTLGSIRPFSATDTVVIQGRPNVSGIEVSYEPAQILEPIFAGGWPTTIHMIDTALASVPKRFQKINGTRRFQAIHSEAMFVRFFEDYRSEVESQHGGDPYGWPSVWNFARVLRNAFAHAGAVSFSNKAARPVSWRSLTYGPNDNGRIVMYQDVTPVELVLLMEEMDGTM